MPTVIVVVLFVLLTAMITWPEWGETGGDKVKSFIIAAVLAIIMGAGMVAVGGGS